MLLQGETVASGGFAAGSFATPSVVAMVQRDGPFGSSYQDVLQVNLPCNADYQYRKRAVPDLAATEHPSEKPSADTGKNTFLACLCYVYRKLPAAGKAILVTSTTTMRAANISDFYMTKYMSMSQEDLGPTMQPLLEGMRRMEESEYRTERLV